MEASKALVNRFCGPVTRIPKAQGLALRDRQIVPPLNDRERISQIVSSDHEFYRSRLISHRMDSLSEARNDPARASPEIDGLWLELVVAREMLKSLSEWLQLLLESPQKEKPLRN